MSWILIANRTGARIVDKQGEDLFLIETIPHAQGRLRDQDIASDRQGRAVNAGGRGATAGGSHTYSANETPQEHDAKNFARDLAEKLRQQRMAGLYERLVLVAEPHFLGLLRHALDDVTAKSVVASVPKDLWQIPVPELGGHLPDLPKVIN